LEVYADFSKIQQVLYNLIDNAIKFSNENSTIFISSFQRHDRIFVSIKDNGVGVPKKDLKKKMAGVHIYPGIFYIFGTIYPSEIQSFRSAIKASTSIP